MAFSVVPEAIVYFATMSVDLEEGAENPSPRASGIWWSNHRLRYNLGLLVAGPLAFVAYAAVGEWCIRKSAAADFEITILTTAFQAVGYLLMMGIANLCYYLGPLSERIVKPNRVSVYRRNTFRLGFWFSVLLPFIVPIHLLMECAFGPKKLIL